MTEPYEWLRQPESMTPHEQRDALLEMLAQTVKELERTVAKRSRLVAQRNALVAELYKYMTGTDLGEVLSVSRHRIRNMVVEHRKVAA